MRGTQLLTDSILHMKHITILEQNFFSSEEVKDIKNKVLGLRSMWYTPPQDLQRNQVTVNYLATALYTASGIGIELYKKNVMEYNPIMFENFSAYYRKIKEVIEDKLKVKAIFSQNINHPGFHIHSNETNNEAYYNHVHYHTDKFDLLGLIPQGKVYSFNIPISVPLNGSSLSYMKDGIQTLEYKEGMLGLWNGDLKHGINTFKLVDRNDYRINMQMHISVINKNAYVFW